MQNFNFETTPIQALLTWFAIGTVLMLLIGYFYVKFCKRWECWCRKKERNEKAYEDLYSEISSQVSDAPVNALSYRIIRAELKQLKALEWQNKEKTEFITLEFLKKFYGCTEKAGEKITEREFINH